MYLRLIGLLVLCSFVLMACASQPALGQTSPAPLATRPAPTKQAAPRSTPAPLPSRQPTPTATPAPQPTSTPTPPVVIGYRSATLAPDETLEQLAAAQGSTADLIAAYNRLQGQPPAGRALIVPQIGPADTEPAPAPLVLRGRSDRPWIALTLDAGANSEPTPRMLAALRERGVRITFFLTGRWISENPDLVREMIAEGHELANHTFNHPDLTMLDADTIRAELAHTEQELQALSEVPIRPLFRPPYGAYSQRTLDLVAAEGYLSIYWTLDSLDSIGEPKSPEFLIERVTTALSPEELPGAIILAHCGSAATADALPVILDRFAEMGFEVRTLSEVLGTSP